MQQYLGVNTENFQQMWKSIRINLDLLRSRSPQFIFSLRTPGRSVILVFTPHIQSVAHPHSHYAYEDRNSSFRSFSHYFLDVWPQGTALSEHNRAGPGPEGRGARGASAALSGWHGLHRRAAAKESTPEARGLNWGFQLGV